MNRKVQTVLIVVAIVLVLALVGMLFGIKWFNDNHIFVGGQPYPKDAEHLNLRGKDISVEHYEALREQLPECVIYWDVPFQGSSYPENTTSLSISSISDREMEQLCYLPELETINAKACKDYEQLLKLQEMYPDVKVLYTVTVDGTDYSQDATEVTVSHLTDEEVTLLGYLPELAAVHAESCTDYPQLVALQEQSPDCAVTYNVTIFGESYPESTTELRFDKPADVSELMEQLGNLTALESVYLAEPACDAQSLVALKDAYPAIAITWDKTVLGQTHSSEDTEFDFSGMAMETTDAVEEAMAYFPNAEKVIMCNCGIDNETMAAFREKMRPEYKVVWSVIVTGVSVRTDKTIFHSSAEGVCLIDEQSYDLKYCEDMIIVDIGHSYVKYIDWVEYMPNLKYLILADNWIKDLTPISSCKNLIYLELMINQHIKDFSPLLGCTALEDLTVSDTYADLTPLAQMTWLKNLWVCNRPVTQEMRNLLTESLPNTTLAFDYSNTGGGWRQLQNYYDMRDMMGLPYNTW